MDDIIDELYIRRLIGGNLRRFRSQQGISQIELANKTDLTHNFINDVENFKKGISTKTLAALSSALNVNPYQLYLPDDTPNNERAVYVNDLKNSFQNAINKVADQYLSKNKNDN